jgi:hypothetical protein
MGKQTALVTIINKNTPKRERENTVFIYIYFHALAEPLATFSGTLRFWETPAKKG